MKGFLRLGFRVYGDSRIWVSGPKDYNCILLGIRTLRFASWTRLKLWIRAVGFVRALRFVGPQVGCRVQGCGAC